MATAPKTEYTEMDREEKGNSKPPSSPAFDKSPKSTSTSPKSEDVGVEIGTAARQAQKALRAFPVSPSFGRVSEKGGRKRTRKHKKNARKTKKHLRRK